MRCMEQYTTGIHSRRYPSWSRDFVRRTMPSDVDQYNNCGSRLAIQPAVHSIPVQKTAGQRGCGGGNLHRTSALVLLQAFLNGGKKSLVRLTRLIQTY